MAAGLRALRGVHTALRALSQASPFRGHASRVGGGLSLRALSQASPFRGHASRVGGGLYGLRMYSTPAHQVILMPALSPTMETGNVVSWSVNVGDEVQAGDVLAEIETDKATMEFEASEDGILAKVFQEAGAKDVKVGEPLCVMAENADDVAALAALQADSLKGASKDPAPEPSASAKEIPTQQPSLQSGASSKAPSQGRVIASPAAKVLAKSRGIDIATLTGTGPGGRITKKDVETTHVREASPVTATAAPTPLPSMPAGAEVAGGAYEDIELTMMRKTIAKRLTESHQTIPMFYTTMDIRMDNLLGARTALNDSSWGPSLGDSSPAKISVNDFVVKASALALMKVPQVNSSWQETFIRQYSHADISVAVSTPAGLITPIVFDADRKGLAEISGDVKRLAALAKENKLQPEQFVGGTFSISNMGMYGVSEFTAIVNPPQSCILAVAGTQKVALPNGETAHVMKVTLTADHRVVDGATAAQWLNAFKTYMEDPRTMLLH